MAAHRYFRLTVSGSASGTLAEIAALELLVAGGADPTIIKNGGTASSDGTDAGSSPDNAFDNDAATAWTSDAAPPKTLTFDFGAGNEQAVVAYAIQAAAVATHAPTDWTLEWSDDNSAWTGLDTQTGASFTDGQRQEFSLATHRVFGVVALDGSPASRIVRVYDENIGTLLGEQTSNAGDGSYQIEISLPDGTNVLVTCHTDYGKPWAASDSVAGANELRTPTTANGHYYSSDAAGTTGATEPAWPTDGGTVLDNGITWTDEGEIDAPLIEGPFIPQAI